MRRFLVFLMPGALTLSLSGLIFASLCALAEERAYMYEGKEISKDQYDAVELVNQGRELLTQSKYKETLQIAEKAVKLAPDLELTQALYGTALSKAGRLNEARDHLLKAISIDDNRPGAWISLGAVYTSMGNTTEALKCYQTYLKKFPDDSHAAMIKSIVELSEKTEINRPADNKDDYFAIACGNDPCRWPAEQMPVPVYISDGQAVTGFRPDFINIVKQSCNDWSAASKGKVSFHFVDSFEKGKIKIYWIDKASELRNAGAASECKVTRNGDVVRAAVIKLLTIDPAGASISSERMKNLSLNQIGAALGITRNSPSPHDSMYFSTTVDNSNASISERDAKTIQRLYSGVEKASYSALNQEATTAMNNGDLPKAVALLSEAHRLYPGMQILADNLGVALYNSGLKELNAGQYQNAIDFYQKAIAVKPDYKSALADLGACYFNLGVDAQNKGDNEVALPFYQKSVSFLEQGHNQELLVRALNNCVDILKTQGKDKEVRSLQTQYSAILDSKK